MIIGEGKINRIRNEFRVRYNAIIFKIAGPESLTDDEIKELIERGLLDTNDLNHGLIKDAYYISRVRNGLDFKERPKVDIKQFREQMNRNGPNLSSREQYAIIHTKRSAGNYLTKLRDSALSSIEGEMRAWNYDERNRLLTEVIRPTIEEGIAEAKTTVNEVASRLRERTKDLYRDWRRVAVTELSNALNLGAADAIMNRNEGQDPKQILVYKIANLDAALCPHCRKFYVESNGITPKVYPLSELMANGSNVGKKTKDWKPTIGATHPHERSFYDPKTKIFTDKGWKRIDEIDANEMVLTHNGRFRKVLSVKRGAKNEHNELFKIKIKIKGVDKIGSLSITPGHPILTARGWVCAENICEHDTLYWMGRCCEVCGSAFPLDKALRNKNKITCSRSCASKLYVKRTWEYRKKNGFHDFKERISSTLKRRYKSGELKSRIRDKDVQEKIQKTLFEKYGVNNPYQIKEIKQKALERTNHPEHRKIIRDRMINGGAVKALRMSVYSNPSKPQLTLYERVKSIFCDSILNEPVGNRYLADIFVPSKKLIIEYDGSYFHKDKEKDDRRDDYLLKHGFATIRYRDRIPSTSELKADVGRVMANHDGKYKLIEVGIYSIQKVEAQKKHKLYDLQIEEDESFVANGIVVHNCELVELPQGWGFPKGANQATFMGKDFVWSREN